MFITKIQVFLKTEQSAFIDIKHKETEFLFTPAPNKYGSQLMLIPKNQVCLKPAAFTDIKY
jgi:hypothetical protein